MAELPETYSIEVDNVLLALLGTRFNEQFPIQYRVVASHIAMDIRHDYPKNYCDSSRLVVDQIKSIVAKCVNKQYEGDIPADLLYSVLDVDEVTYYKENGPKEVHAVQDPLTKAYCFYVTKLGEPCKKSFRPVPILWGIDGDTFYTYGPTVTTESNNQQDETSATEMVNNAIEKYASTCSNAVAEELGHDRSKMTIYSIVNMLSVYERDGR